MPLPKADVTADDVRQIIQNSSRPYVLLNFFATWCKPCRKEMPDLVALHKDAASQVEVVLISLDNPDAVETKLRSFLADMGVDFQTYAVPSAYPAFVGQFYTLWNGDIPLSLIFSKDGRMVEALTGLTDRAEIELIVNMHAKLGS